MSRGIGEQGLVVYYASPQSPVPSPQSPNYLNTTVLLP